MQQIILNGIALADLLNEFRAIVKEEVDNHSNPLPQSTTGKDYLTPKEAADVMMRVKARKIQRKYPHAFLEKATSTTSKTAIEKVFFAEFLSDKATSCTAAAEALNIPQKHLTWYKRELEKLGMLQVVKMDKCPYTKRQVQFITTDPAQFREQFQKLWCK